MFVAKTIPVMSSNITIIICLFLLNYIVHIQALVELPIVEDNNIASVEDVIRNTVNNLFVAFKIEKAKHGTRLKQYSTIHNYFVSITLQDCKNLKEIARLTRVNNIDNNTQHFIAQINEVLNEDDKSKEADNNKYVATFINMLIRKFKYLKHRYVPDDYTVINADILKYLNDIISLKKYVEKQNKNVLSDNEIWQSSGRRIYRGIRTSIKTFPFMASIQFFKKFQCAGSIIKSDLVITSSSCLQLAWNNRFFRENPAFLSVQVGSDYYETGGENIAVIDIYFHPNYDPKTLKHNLAVMRLVRKINFKNDRVKKIVIDKSPQPMPVNSGKITVVGWGAKDSTNVISDIFRHKLSYAYLNYYPHDDCEERYSKEFVTSHNFCAGYYVKGGGACNRDAGGPGIIEDILVGIISFGTPVCGAPDSPTVFTKLGYYTDWIETIMEQVVPHGGARTTTTIFPLFHLFQFNKMTTVKKITPIPRTTGTPSLPILDLDALRLGADESLEHFLSTLFEKETQKEYFENYNDETSKEEYNVDLDEKDAALLDEIIYSNAGGMREVTNRQEIKTTMKPMINVTILTNDDNRKFLETDILKLIDN